MHALIAPNGSLVRMQVVLPNDLLRVKAGYRWLPVVRVSVSTATGPDTVTETTQGEADGEWRITSTTRDMTAQEISDRDDAIVADQTGQALGRALWLAYNALFYLARSPHASGLTLAQFKAALENPANQAIDEAAFRAWVKEGLR